MCIINLIKKIESQVDGAEIEYHAQFKIDPSKQIFYILHCCRQNHPATKTI